MRTCFVSRVDPANLDAYRDAHTAVWPEMLEALRDTGWRGYTLHLGDDGLLVGVVDLDDSYDAAQARMAATEVNARWQAAMAKHFSGSGAPDQGMRVLPTVFDLEAQLLASGLPTRPPEAQGSSSPPNHHVSKETSMETKDYRELADRVLGMLRDERPEEQRDGHLTMDNWEWPTGVALYGLFKVYEKTGDPDTLDYLVNWYDRRLAMEPPHRNVNTVGPMLALVGLYEVTRKEAYLTHIESWVRWVMEEMPRTQFGGLQHNTVWNKHYQQLWDDTLFMTVLFLAKAGRVLDRPELIDEAEYQFLIHIKYLQDKVTGLFYHGWTFDRRHNFAEVFWARGNSWFTSAAVEFIEISGRKGATTRYIEAALRDQVCSLWKLQRENGHFTTLLDVEETYCETSAAAGIAFGVLKGVRLGLLDGQMAEVGMRAAAAVIDMIDETGAVQGVSGGTGMGHSADFYKQIEVRPAAYGQGLTFLMLTEFI